MLPAFVGVDIGGTFTDLVLNVDGHLKIYKLLSTPDDPARAMLAGLAAVNPEGLAMQISHGSTVATNAILERKGARTALITTQGFRDLLAIGRQNRPDLYALQPRLPTPLIPRQWCYEVPERLDYTGVILKPLNIAVLDTVLDEIVAQGIESVAICLLYSYVNPAHEQAVRARILERGLLQRHQIALSCEVLPEFREYERASTVAVEAYVRPVMSRYLARLEEKLSGDRPLRIMKSDGGVISARQAREQAVQTVLSGPAAGVIGAFYLAKQAGYDRIITLDIGGTSTDVALCPGVPSRRAEAEIDGLPLRIGLLDIETIGAGGGSIARLDSGGALRVGPESAGADPGPIVYGRGGQQITVSDANAVLGRLDADHFLGGTMALDLIPAQQQLAALGTQMATSAEAAALGVIQIANVNIDRAIRRVSVTRGYDPREFTLVAFGGAGPLHACEVAERLDIPSVLIPRYPGVLCAFGLLAADVVIESSAPILQPVTADLMPSLLARRDSMIAQAHSDLLNEGIAEREMQFECTLDMRYRGQAHELSVPFDDDIVAGFHAIHASRYGHAMPERAVEIVNLRVQATGLVVKPPLTPAPLIVNDGQAALIGHKSVVLKDGSHSVPLFDREQLQPGARFSGPALVFQLDSTVFIPVGWTVQVDAYTNLILSK
ncbi:MAG: hydantoinase/oxoprolinase family protein [Chloroflexota bacterium]